MSVVSRVRLEFRGGIWVGFCHGVPFLKRLYICLEPLKRGFTMNCMPFIGLDACHLIGVYGGQLITAVGIDPNKETWVLAYVVVEMETRESWTWFIDLLAKDLGIVNSHGCVFISDKQKGLSGAFEDIVPNAETTFCVRHFGITSTKLIKDEAKAAAKARRKLASVRAKAAAAAKKTALNASQPNAADIAGIGLRTSKRQRT